MKRKTIIILIAILLTGILSAQVGLEKVAQSSMNFQLVSVSPKASSMGEAFCAVGSGAESIFFNPAGIVESSNKFDIKLYSTQWIADINYMATAFTWNTGKYGAFGLSMLNVDYGLVNGTSLITKEEASIYTKGYKDNGPVSNLGAYSLGVSYGKAFSSEFIIAGNMRYVGQNLGQTLMADSTNKNNNATKLVFDAGVKYFTGLKSFTLGMSIRNFSSNIKREEIDEQLPLLFTMGMSVDILDFIAPSRSINHSLLLSADFAHPNNYTERLNVGVDLSIFNMFSIRGGFQNNQDLASWSAGLGLKKNIGKKIMAIDYSYSNFDLFKGVSRFSIGFAL